MFTLPTPGSLARVVTVLYGVLVFIWLSPEDNPVWLAAALGLGLAGLIILWTAGKRLGSRPLTARQLALVGVLLGLLVGLGSSVTTGGLMFFKNALHAHIFPDFPPGLLLAMVSRAPAWTVAGGLAGLGVALIWLVKKK